jgi:hypothetical protein
MTAASAEELLAFVGEQFASVDQPDVGAYAAETFLPEENNGLREAQRVVVVEDEGRGMMPMRRYLACKGQPLQITVAQPSTHDGKEK